MKKRTFVIIGLVMLLLQVNAQKKVSNKVTDNLIVTTLITNVKIMDGSGKPAIMG